MALIRWLLIGIGVVLLLVVALVVGAMLLIDTRDIQNRIAAEVEEATGREMTFEGDLSLSFFPWLGFEQGAARLANAEGFEDDGPFAAIDRMQLRVAVRPLLRRQVEVDTIVLDGLEVNVGVDADGRTSWADIEERMAAAAAERDRAGNHLDGEPSDDNPEGGSASGNPSGDSDGRAPDELPFDLEIGGFELSAAAINWHDRATDTRASVRDLDITLGRLALDREVPVTLAVTLDQEDGPRVELDASTDARLRLEPAELHLTGLGVDIEGHGDDLPADGIPLRLDADIVAEIDAGQAAIEPLQLKLAEELDGEGRINATFGDEPPQFNGRFDFAEFDARVLADRLDAELPEMADDEALTAVAFGFDVEGDPEAVTIDDFVLELDDTRAQGRVLAELDEIPYIDARLEADAIDLDRYLPEDADEEIVVDEEPAPEDIEEEEDPIASLPLEALRAVNADARLGIDEVGFSGLDARDVTAIVELRDGLLTVEEAGFDVAGGRIGLDGRLDAREAEPAAALAARIDSLQAEPLMGLFLPRSPLTGRMDSQIVLDTAGGTLEDWLGALNGDLAAQFDEGTIRGFSIEDALYNASARMRGADEREVAETVTPFRALSAVARVRDGVLETRSFNLQSDRLQGTGEGSIDLARREIDYRASFTVLERVLEEDIDADQRLEGLTIPITLTGALFSPSVRIDLTGALRDRAREEADRARQELRREADEAREAAEERLREERDDARRRLEERARDLFDR